MKSHQDLPVTSARSLRERGITSVAGAEIVEHRLER